MRRMMLSLVVLGVCLCTSNVAMARDFGHGGHFSGAHHIVHHNYGNWRTGYPGVYGAYGGYAPNPYAYGYPGYSGYPHKPVLELEAAISRCGIKTRLTVRGLPDGKENAGPQSWDPALIVSA